jgi:CHAD domain-containing protein
MAVDTGRLRERELKYEADGAPDLGTLGGEPLERREFTSVYYDTPDRRLATAGATLRRRLERGTNLWQLKVPDGGARLELEAAGGPAGPPEPLERLLRPQLAGRALVQLATLKTTRTGRLIDGIAVTLDQVEVLEGQHVLDRFAEIEAELVADGGDLPRVDRLLLEAGARRTDQEPKIWRVVGPPPRESRPRRKAPPLAHVQARLAALQRDLLEADLGFRVRDDPEDVHQLRVTTRRLRALLRTARRMFDPEWAEAFRSELEYLADALGHVRDLDVLIAHLEEEAARLDGGDAVAAGRLPALLREKREPALTELRTVLDGDRYRALLETLEQAVAAPPVRDADVRLERVARKAFRRLAAFERALPADPGDGDLHRLRILGKRARYAGELAAPLEGARADRFVEAAKRFQDVLGDHQDAAVAEETIRELAGRLPNKSAALAAGRLIALQRDRRDRARKTFRSDWKRLRQAGDRAWR